jgi:predicted N-acetyltransferase YhbS
MGWINLNSIQVRLVMESDFQDICLLSKELGYECDEQKVKKRIKYILKNTKDIIFIAEQGDEVIGYIHGSPYELLFADSLVNILGLVVNAQHRKLGVGGRLIEKLEGFAKENGFSGIRLVSGSDRLIAHKFYESHEYVYRKNQKSFIKIFD